jgi:WD40 repeat protein
VLGQGAYGKVYRAFDPDLGREVALKILKRDVSNPDVLRQVRQEAWALAQLRHRNILSVFEDGLHGSAYFIVSKLVDARPLSVILAEERVAARQAACWVRDLAEALAHAHRQGILHRDVKPANILITARSEPLLADFGLALDFDELREADAVRGTPAYMAPEQIDGNAKQVGPHSDQYSLGVVLHELLTGRRPFHDQVPGQPERPPTVPSPLASHVDRKLEAICLKALAYSAAERYPSLHAMAEDLSRWLSGKKVEAKPRRRRVGHGLKRHAALLSAIAGALVLAVLLLAQRLVMTRTIAGLERDRLNLTGEMDRRNRAFDANLVEHNDLFERERVSLREPLARLHLRSAETFEAAGSLLEAGVHFAAAIDCAAPSWDGNEKQRVREKLAALAGRLVRPSHPSRWPRFGGPMPRVLVPEVSDWLGIESDRPTRRWPARVPDPNMAGWRRDRALAVSPGGEYAVLITGTIWRSADGSTSETSPLWYSYFSVGLGGRSLGGMRRLADGSMVETLPLHNPHFSTAAAFRPDGRTVLIAVGSKVRFWDAATGKPTGDAVAHPQNVTAAAFAPDGRSALAAGEDQVIRRLDPTTGQAGGEVLRHPVPVNRLRFEPDGRVFTTLGNDDIERRWDAETGLARGIPVAHELKFTTCATGPDGRSLLKVMRGSTIPEQRYGQIWDRDGHPLGPLFPMFSTATFTRIADPDGEAILAGAVHGPLLSRLAIVPAGWLSHDGNVAIDLGLTRRIRILDVAALQWRSPALELPGQIEALSRNGEVAATGGGFSGAVTLWSTTRGKPIAALDLRGTRVSRISLSPDGGMALVWSEPVWRAGAPAPRSEISRWAVATAQRIGPPLCPGSGISSAEFSPDGSTILMLGNEGARLWNAATGKLVGSWPLVARDSVLAPAAKLVRSLPIAATHFVLAAAFDPDGKTLATGGKDGILWRWSTSSGRAAGPPLLVGSEIRFIAYAAKGRTLMAVSADSTTLWDVETGRQLAPPLPAGGHGIFQSWSPDGAALSRDRMRIVTKEASTGRTRLWDATTGRPLGPFCIVEGTPAFLSDDGSAIVTTGTRGPRIWDLTVAVETGPLYPFGDEFEIVARSHDGNRILARLATGPGANDSGTRREGKSTRRYQLRDASSGRPAGERFTLEDGMSVLALGPDGRLLVVQSLTQASGSEPSAWSRLYDAQSGKPLSQQLPGSTTGFSPDGQLVVVDSVAWPVPLTNADDRLLQLDPPVVQVAFEPDGRAAVAFAGRADLRRWDLATGRVLYRLPDRKGRSVLCLSPDGRLAVVAEGKVARLLRVETGRELGEALNHSKPVVLASFAPDSKMVVASDGMTCQVWDASTGRPVGKPRSCDGNIFALAMGPAGAVYVEETHVPDAKSPNRSHRHVVFTGAANRRVVVPELEYGGRATFSPDGRYLYIEGPNLRRLWDLSDDPPRPRPESVARPSKNARAIAFAGDGRTYAIAYDDATMEVRDTATDRRIGLSGKLDRQNPWAAASERNPRVSGGTLRSFPAERRPTALSFSPDGHTLLIGFYDGLIRLLTVPLAVPEQGVSRWLERRTAVRLRSDLTIEALERDELLDRWSESGEVR